MGYDKGQDADFDAYLTGTTSNNNGKVADVAMRISRQGATSVSIDSLHFYEAYYISQDHGKSSAQTLEMWTSASSCDDLSYDDISACGTKCIEGVCS